MLRFAPPRLNVKYHGTGPVPDSTGGSRIFSMAGLAWLYRVLGAGLNTARRRGPWLGRVWIVPNCKTRRQLAGGKPASEGRCTFSPSSKVAPVPAHSPAHCWLPGGSKYSEHTICYLLVKFYKLIDSTPAWLR